MGKFNLGWSLFSIVPVATPSGEPLWNCRICKLSLLDIFPDFLQELSKKDQFGQIESKFADTLPRIIERAGPQQLTNDDLNVLAYFMSVQRVRTPAFRELVQKLRSK